MSKYTTEIRFICESLAGLTDSAGYSSVDVIIQTAIPKIFDFSFPIYDENYRNVLCTKILKHYYTREIGLETYGLWKLKLDTRLNEIMPYYNQLYKSALIEFNPMYDVDLTTARKGSTDDTTDVTENNSSNQTGNSTSNETADGTNKRWDVFSETPQGALDNVENETYLTNARKITDNRNDARNNVTNYSNNISGQNTGKTVAKSTEEYTQTITGKNGGASYSKRLQEFRNTFINIDAMIIDNLADLFMNLW